MSGSPVEGSHTHFPWHLWCDFESEKVTKKLSPPFFLFLNLPVLEMSRLSQLDSNALIGMMAVRLAPQRQKDTKRESRGSLQNRVRRNPL